MKNKIIGQEKLVSNIERIFNIFINSECRIRPHFIITGESGSTKTFAVKAMANELNISFIEINAAQLTKEGTSGNSLSKALSPLLNVGNKPCVCFVDEFDKLFISGNSNSSSAHETTTGVQNEFLKVLECDVASVFGDYGKYINVPTTNILFVFAGAFNGEKDINLDRLREIGIKTEFLGRVSLVYNSEKLTLDEMYQILDNSDLFKDYLELFNDIDREKASYEMKDYISKQYENNTIGARMINSIINTYFINGGIKKDNIEKNTFNKKMNF